MLERVDRTLKIKSLAWKTHYFINIDVLHPMACVSRFNRAFDRLFVIAEVYAANYDFKH